MMKQLLLFSVCSFLFLISHAQVTQINANKSLFVVSTINSTLTLCESSLDSSIWVSDGTKNGTFQISDTIKFIEAGDVLNGTYVFKGTSPNCGMELFKTDGTPAGTTIIKDINPGIANSQPLNSEVGKINNFIYFAAVTVTEGCELWRTDGTKQNTTIVKDIGPGATSGIDTASTNFSFVGLGSNIIFTATTPANGNELWQTDGTPGNTSLLKDIDAQLPSSYPRYLYPYNHMLLFTVTSSDGNTDEVWRTDGSPGGTVLLKDNIAASSPDFILFHTFKNRAYFMIDDNMHAGDAIYSTDGIAATPGHTDFLKDLGTLTFFGSVLFADAVNLPDKFIFPYFDLDFSTSLSTINELYQCDGTVNGTKVFKSFAINTVVDHIPLIFLAMNIDKSTATITYPLYKGNFYFAVDDGADGYELWMSDGTNTQMLKDINPGSSSAIGEDDMDGILFTSQGLFFSADDGVHGSELWKSDGTKTGTDIVQDIFPGVHNANPVLGGINNGKIFFSAKDSDPADSSASDLFVVDGNFAPLPVNLLDFTVSPKGSDALLQWSTAQEINSCNFMIESSDDAQHWNQLGTVKAAGNSTLQTNYKFIDRGIMNSGKSIVYYKLKETDLDNKITTSNIIYLKIKGNRDWKVELYANPVRQNRIGVMLTGIVGNAALVINDLNGRVIYKRRLENQNGFLSIPADMPPGIYVLRVQTSSGSKSVKFVKE